jgi:hypothetical protein
VRSNGERAAAIDRLKSFGRKHGLSLGGMTIRELRHEGAPVTGIVVDASTIGRRFGGSGVMRPSGFLEMVGKHLTTRRD